MHVLSILEININLILYINMGKIYIYTEFISQYLLHLLSESANTLS